MYLTISKKFEISCSHRVYNQNWDEEKNQKIYGIESKGEYGHGHNFDVTFVFNGPVNQKTGMVINVSEIKKKINSLLLKKYDHKFLNLDTKPFDNLIPTIENISNQLLKDAKTLFDDSNVDLVVCHLSEEPDINVTAFPDDIIMRTFQMDFSAARRTYSPNLSDVENLELFGQASNKSGHGHHYKAKWKFQGNPDEETGLITSEFVIKEVLKDLHEKYDHKNLNVDIDDLKNKPITTEILCRQLFNELSSKFEIENIRLNENDYFFIEYDKTKTFKMGLKSAFHAAHRLYTDSMDEQELDETYSNCANPNGHGHKYKVEMVLYGDINERTGIVYNLMDVLERFENILNEWDYKHLDLETDDFKYIISTGENIVGILWQKLNREFDNKLSRLSLWETNNNRFTIRKVVN